MRISDVENHTGLTRKTIRFCEAKGLLTGGRAGRTLPADPPRTDPHLPCVDLWLGHTRTKR